MITKAEMQTAAFSNAERTSSYWIALIFMAVLGGIQIYFYDITFHGPDQIRDVEIARKLIHEGQWPLNGPPLFGERFHLPPAFYYLLAIPLLVRDSEVAIFITFGSLFALSVWYLWRSVYAQLGPRYALAYVTLAFPVFASFYTHSAWNPALVMTLSNVVLGLFLRLVNQRSHDSLMLPVATFLLAQIHPSAIPLGIGLCAYALLNYQILKSRKTLTSLLVIGVLTALWVVKSGSITAPRLAAQNPVSTPSGGGWLSNLLDLEKWRDVFLMPYTAIESIQPAIPGLGTLVGFHLSLIWLGALLGLAFAIHGSRTIRWILAITVIWFIVSMAFLSQGAFWHLDVVHPWVAILAAYGWVRASEKIRLADWRFITLAFASLILVVSAHLALYIQFEKKGRYDLVLASLFFPNLSPSEHKIPAYTFRHLHAVRDSLASQKVCQDQVTGLDPMVTGNAVNRTLDLACPSRVLTGQGPSTLYFIANERDSLKFDFTKDLQPAIKIGVSTIYAVKNSGALVNGTTANNISSDEKINYMTYLPAHLEKGLNITLPLISENILRVALRCGKDYPLEQDQYWKINGAELKKPLIATHVRYLGTVYYDLEWTLAPTAGQTETTAVSSTLGPLDCDVSVIARPSLHLPTATTKTMP